MRTISIVLQILDPNEASAIWDAFGKNSLFHGSLITTISNGDAIKRADQAEEAVGKVVDEINDGSFNEKEFIEWQEGRELETKKEQIMYDEHWKKSVKEILEKLKEKK